MTDVAWFWVGMGLGGVIGFVVSIPIIYWRCMQIVRRELDKCFADLRQRYP